MIHQLMQTWFEWVREWGYLGIVVLMAMESSIIPVPSEIVMAPAGFWAAQGRMSFWGVVLAGTVGSYLGSIISYWGARWVGRPALHRFGKYIMLSPDKVAFAEAWVKSYGTSGILVARFLPVIRHLISMPAGVFRMKLMPFSLATISGAGIWCWILAWFGAEAIGDRPELLESPLAMVQVMKERLHWFVLAVVLFAALYGVVLWAKHQKKRGAVASS